MGIGFVSKSGHDIGDLFLFGFSPNSPVTGYKTNNGQDLQTIFEPGNSGFDTGFKIPDGRDLGQIFARSPLAPIDVPLLKDEGQK